MASLAKRRIAPTSTYKVQFGPAPQPAESQGRLPRVTRLLALAHQIDRKIRDGELRDYAHAADALGITRARMSQITNLLLLAPVIQENILGFEPRVEGRDPITERQVRPIAAEPDWQQQIQTWRKIYG